MCVLSDRFFLFKLMLRFVFLVIDEEFVFLKEFEKGEYRNYISMDSYKNIYSKYCNRIYQVKFFFSFIVYDYFCIMLYIILKYICIL